MYTELLELLTTESKVFRRYNEDASAKSYTHTIIHAIMLVPISDLKEIAFDHISVRDVNCSLESFLSPIGFFGFMNYTGFFPRDEFPNVFRPCFFVHTSSGESVTGSSDVYLFPYRYDTLLSGVVSHLRRSGLRSPLTR